MKKYIKSFVITYLAFNSIVLNAQEAKSKIVINEEFNEYWPSQRGTTRYHSYRFDAVYYVVGRGVAGAARLGSEAIGGVASEYLGTNIRIGKPEELTLLETWK